MNNHDNEMNDDRELSEALAHLGKEHRATPGLEAKIIAGLPPRDSLQSIVDWLTGALWRPVLAAAVTLVFGFVVGIMIPEDDSQLADELSLLVFSEAYEELEDDF